MANQEHLDLLNLGVAQWNAWRKRNHGQIGLDLSGANLRGADLSNAHLNSPYPDMTQVHRAHLTLTNLSEAHLSGADLSGTDLNETNLRRADLSDANLSCASMARAYLDEADLSGADLRGADLNGANLRGANLRHARVGQTSLANMDLRATKGLAEIMHQGPSFVQLHTVLLPRDGSALHFLRGTGFPEVWIDFWRTTMMHPVQYHSLFISYSSADDMLARRLYADLQANGVRCWITCEDRNIDDKTRLRIDEAVHLQSRLLLLLSRHTIASAWVEEEVEAALEKEQRQQREVLFLARLDESVMQTTQAWVVKLRQHRPIGDFTHWTDQQRYQRAFDRLLRDLKEADEECHFLSSLQRTPLNCDTKGG